MSEEKEIIAKVIILNNDNEDDEIFFTYNAYDLRNYISFPLDTESTTLHKGNKFIIDETEYLIEEITVDIFRPESEVLQNNLQVIIFVTKVETE